ncbi:Hypp8781 [Branchiostoma lanceolatum]|uniref:Hypp8781 protein n=1 Tax=Branchiostoma lanceolatum TaxID=7740 RepID=A0A8K0EJ25_BRALA|nr:Hypp8781 [Branchiostoma lanceolatum]
MSFCDGYVALFLEKRKNDQFREGNWICIAATDSVSCPVSLLKRFLKSSNSSGHIKLFRRVANHNGNLFLRRDPMSYTRARETALAMLSTIGLDPTKYGLHSLRSAGWCKHCSSHGCLRPAYRASWWLAKCGSKGRLHSGVQVRSPRSVAFPRSLTSQLPHLPLLTPLLLSFVLRDVRTTIL